MLIQFLFSVVQRIVSWKLAWHSILILGVVTLTSVKDVTAKDYVWIIGGGATPDSSQVSIEKNVIWISELIKNLPGERAVQIYYTDGAESSADVSAPCDSSDCKGSMEPLSRIFGNYKSNKMIYRNHNIDNVKGGTKKEEILKKLNKDFASTVSGDRAIIIFNTHGLKAKDAEAGTTIRLWADTTLSVLELRQLIDKFPSDVPVMVFLPQCYSGGFWRLINKDATEKLSITSRNICAFFAESEYRKSEG